MELFAGYAIAIGLAIWVVSLILDVLKVWLPRVLIIGVLIVITVMVAGKVVKPPTIDDIFQPVIPEAKPIIHTTVNAYRVNTKPGVNIKKLNPNLDAAIPKIVSAYQSVLGNGYVPTITSGNDSDAHKRGSAHYRGAALDFRLKDIESKVKRRKVVYAVRNALGEKFFVDHEFMGGANEHLHVQLR